MKAMLLAAGLGTRLGDLTREVPKPMLPIGGRPLLEYGIAQLQRHGFDDIVINLHYRPEMICEYFGDGSRWGVNLTYSYEPDLLGTAGGVKNVAGFFADAHDFLIQYGDILTDEDFSAMFRFHRSHSGLATLLIHQRSVSNSVVCINDEYRIERFLERPNVQPREGIESKWVHSGVCIARRDLLDFIVEGASDLPRDVYMPLVKQGRPLFAWPLSGYRCAIDSPQRLEEARAAIRAGSIDIALPAFEEAR